MTVFTYQINSFYLKSNFVLCRVRYLVFVNRLWLSLFVAMFAARLNHDFDGFSWCTFTCSAQLLNIEHTCAMLQPASDLVQSRYR
jgi:hypothetical protein